MGLALTWLLLPAVFLNVPSNYIDVTCASLWLSAVLFLARSDATDAHRFFGALALGLYAGSKVTGALHAVLLIPLVVLILWQQIGFATWRWIPRALGMGAVITALGGATYIRNVAKFGNPFWPVRTRLAGRDLPGTVDVTPLITPPWGGPDDLASVWRSFFEPNPPYMVDVRVGGFGSLLPWVLLPCLVLALGIGAKRGLAKQTTPGLLAIAVLVLTALAQPAAWWGRYTLALPAAGLLAMAVVLSRVRRTWIPQAALVALAVWAVVQAWPARVGFYGPLELLEKSARMTPAERASQSFFVWHNPSMSHREAFLEPGEAAIYDDSISLLYPLWRFDWQNRVLYRPFTGSFTGWIGQLEADRARWAAVRRNGPAEAALRSAGWTPLGPCQKDDCAMWSRPRGPTTSEPRSSAD